MDVAVAMDGMYDGGDCWVGYSTALVLLVGKEGGETVRI